MKKILITAFDPFGGKSINSSLETLKHLEFFDDQVKVDTLILPTVFKSVEDVIRAKIDLAHPDVILMLGEAGGTSQIRLERVAINIDDARIPDNENYQPVDVPISKDGEPAYFSTLPIKKIQASLIEHDIPVVISNSAGTYVCNHLMYITLKAVKQKKASNVIAGFIHFPYIENQVQPDQAFLPLNTSVKALSLIIKSCL